MEITSEENLQDTTLTSNDVAHQTEDVEPQLSNQGSRDAETTGEITEEELGGILEVIAATGKFWHDWDTLRGLLSFRLKQVLADYPEAGMDQDQQSSALGEPYVELVRRLDEALFSFTEGPPFTLQRLCEILLTARSIYPNLSKLALALEKNLLVTSTLTISTDPYPSTTIAKSDEPDKGSVVALAHSSPLQNGLEPVVRDEDEEMADAEEIAVENKSEIPEEMADAEEIAVENKSEIPDAEKIAVDNKIEMEDAEETAIDNKSEMKDVEETAVDSKKDMADMEEIDIDSKKDMADMEEIDIDSKKEMADMEAIDIDGKKEMADADTKSGEKESTEESTNGTAEVSSTLSTSSDPSGESSLPSEHTTSTS